MSDNGIKYPLQIYRSNGCLTIYKSDFSRDLLWIKDFKCILLFFLLSFTRLNSYNKNLQMVFK